MGLSKNHKIYSLLKNSKSILQSTTMKKILYYLTGVALMTVVSSCDGDFEVTIPDFNFPQTITFEQNLSTYNIFKDTLSDLTPADDYHLMELSSILFTDYAKKQRLIKVPVGTQMERLNDGSINFPDGTILVKTFFYYNDERDTSLGKRIIESRLMIKEESTWNIATYLWNDAQTDATLKLDGLDTPVNWVNASGQPVSTLYHVPNENECITCHQSNSTMIPLGTKLRNLNREVERGGGTLNQINHLQAVGVLNDFSVDQVPTIVDYNDLSNSLADRGRAYLELNCAHCHNPDAWEVSANQDLDFRYETSLNLTGILGEEDQIIELVSQGEMPFIGTTMLDNEGVALIVEFIENL
jgi:uncharacterized repeat protein (TIGR03806 family)